MVGLRKRLRQKVGREPTEDDVAKRRASKARKHDRRIKEEAKYLQPTRRFIKDDKKIADFVKLDKIGGGTYGNLHTSTDDVLGCTIVMKIPVSRDQSSGPTGSRTDEGLCCGFMREVAMLRRLRHANIIRLRHLIVDELQLCMLLDLMQCDLKHYYQNALCGCLLPSETRAIMRQMAHGLRYCHSHGVLHRDMKPNNVLVRSAEVHNDGDRGEDCPPRMQKDCPPLIQIADFDQAIRLVPGRLNTHCAGTIWYRPPEMILGDRKYGTAVDMWALGCIHVELRTGKALFTPMDAGECFECVAKVLGAPVDHGTWADAIHLPNFESAMRSLGSVPPPGIQGEPVVGTQPDVIESWKIESSARARFPCQLHTLLRPAAILRPLFEEWEARAIESLLVWDPKQRASIDALCSLLDDNCEEEAGEEEEPPPPSTSTADDAAIDAAIPHATTKCQPTPPTASVLPADAAASATTTAATTAGGGGVGSAAHRGPAAWYAAPSPVGFMERCASVNSRMRTILILWLMEVHSKFTRIKPTQQADPTKHGSLHLACSLIDRYLIQCPSLPTSKLQLLGATSYCLAGKLLEESHCCIEDITYISDNAYTADAVRLMEMDIVRVLDGDVLVCTVSEALHDAYGVLGGEERCSLRTRAWARYLADLSLLDVRLTEHAPTTLAAVCLRLAASAAATELADDPSDDDRLVDDGLGGDARTKTARGQGATAPSVLASTPASTSMSPFPLETPSTPTTTTEEAASDVVCEALLRLLHQRLKDDAALAGPESSTPNGDTPTTPDKAKLDSYHRIAEKVYTRYVGKQLTAAKA